MGICLTCGAEFESGYPRTNKEKVNKFCSLECRKIYNKKLNGILRNQICNICGSIFKVPSSSNKKICSDCLNEKVVSSRYISPRECNVCGKTFSIDWRKESSSRRTQLNFCSQKCNNTFLSRKNKGKTKTLVCPVCNKEFITSIHSKSNSRCEDCRNKSTNKEYKFPKETIIGKFERSKIYIEKSCSLYKLGFDFENPNLEEEFLKIQKLLVTEYEINLKSADTIEREYKLSQGVISTKLLNLFNIKKRNKSEIMSLSALNSPKCVYKKDSSEFHSQYKSGYHIDWEGKSHFLRSSYEFNLAEKLDERRIHYETEFIRIRYFDSLNRVYKTGVPDFYLPEYNLIIETKSNYFYNELDLKDREIEINKLGFRFYVLLDKEKIIDKILPLDKIEKYLTLDEILKLDKE